MNKWKNILIWGSIMTYLLLTLGFVTGKENQVVCNTVAVRVTDSTENLFVRKRDIFATLERNKIQLRGHALKSINTQTLESVIAKSPFIKDVEAFKTISGAVKIEVNQRNPILRVINKQRRNYYIDHEGVIIPLSANYASHVLVANGHITEPFEIKAGNSILCPGDGKNNIICDVFTLANFIIQDEFLNAQIEQIYVNEKKEFELVPRVGSQIILFGKINDCEEKFQKLKSLYVNGFSKTGWNKYVKINLKYKNQVICTKR